MTAIEEDYVSLETAKLLKEKGFKGLGNCFYERGRIIDFNNYWWRIAPKERYDSIQAPTLQMAMKWLREAHKLYINIWADPKDVESNDFNIIFRAHVYNGTSNYGTHEFSTYEEAAEESIKFCLNII